MLDQRSKNWILEHPSMKLLREEVIISQESLCHLMPMVVDCARMVAIAHFILARSKVEVGNQEHLKFLCEIFVFFLGAAPL